MDVQLIQQSLLSALLIGHWESIFLWSLKHIIALFCMPECPMPDRQWPIAKATFIELGIYNLQNGFNYHEVRWIGPRSRGGSNYLNEISFDRMSLIDPKRAYTLIALDLNLFSLAGGGTMWPPGPDFTKTLKISGYPLNLIKRLKFYDICLKSLNKKRSSNNNCRLILRCVVPWTQFFHNSLYAYTDESSYIKCSSVEIY